MLITSSRVIIKPDNKIVELYCEYGHSITVVVGFTNDYKTIDVFERTFLRGVFLVSDKLINRYRDYLIKEAKKRIGIKLLRNLIQQNPRGYCIGKNMDNAAIVVLEVDPDENKEVIESLLDFEKSFADVFEIRNFQDSLLNHNHIWLINYLPETLVAEKESSLSKKTHKVEN